MGLRENMQNMHIIMLYEHQAMVQWLPLPPVMSQFRVHPHFLLFMSQYILFLFFK